MRGGRRVPKGTTFGRRSPPLLARMSTIAQNEQFRVTFWKNIWCLMNACRLIRSNQKLAGAKGKQKLTIQDKLHVGAAVALDDIDHAVMAGEDDQGIAAPDHHLIMRLDFDAAITPVQDDIHVVIGLKAADRAAIQK